MDPYEEERRARFIAPIDMLLTALDRVRKELIAIKQTESPELCVKMFDNAMDLLFNTMLLCKPMAMMETRAGRIAFQWVTSPEGQEPTYYWIVCRNNGTYKFGMGNNQKDCEKATGEALVEE